MIELIPAIDLIEGKCVRLTKGDYDSQKVYNEDPVAVAREFEAYGFKRLHVVDLDGARSSHVVNYPVLERIANATNLTIDFGGGIKTNEDVKIAIQSGAHLITVGSIAVTQPDLFLDWMQQIGCERVILGADVRDNQIAINGWKEHSDTQLIPFLEKYIRQGVKNVLCTDISKDGTLQGPAMPLYRDIMKNFPDCHLIASGGVSSMNDLQNLSQEGIPAVVFGKAIYEGRIQLDTLARWMEENQ